MSLFGLALGMMHIERPRKVSNFQDPSPPVHLRPKFFRPLDLGRPISNKPLPNDTVHLNKQNQNKNKTESRHSNWPRALLFDLAHKQSNGIIKGWLHCLTSESKGRFLVNNTLMFGTAWCMVMVQIQFFSIKIKKIDVQNTRYTGSNSCRKELTISSKAESVESIVSALMTTTMMMMNCFCGMVDQRKVFSLISIRDHCQRSSP